MEVDLEFALWDISAPCTNTTLEQAFRSEPFTTAILPESPDAHALEPFTGQCAIADLSKITTPEVSEEEIDLLLDRLHQLSTKFSKRYSCEIPVPPRLLLRLRERVLSEDVFAILVKRFTLIGIDSGTTDGRNNNALINQAGLAGVYLLANLRLPDAADDGILYDLYAAPVLAAVDTKLLPARAIVIPR